MAYQRKSPDEFPVEELDRELIARGAQIPWEERFRFKDREGTPGRDFIMAQVKELYQSALPENQAFSHISTPELVKKLIYKTREIKRKGARGIWYEDDRKDFYEITDEQIRNNALCTTAICLKHDLIDDKKGFSSLNVKEYGRTFNLCDCEPFYRQPAAAGHLHSGVLVTEDTVATAGHCVNETNVTDLRIVFGFKMLGPSTPITWISNDNIYKGVKIFRRAYNRKVNGADWALVKLDRNVAGQEIARLSGANISRGQPIYVMGYPVGLPLKYAPGACVCSVNENSFTAGLNIYSGNSGSPVFDRNTHEVIGIVVRGDNRDFRWAGKCWVSVIHPNPDIYSHGAQCTRVSQFIGYCW